MYGWRARVGLILPSLNATMEPDLNRLAPDGVHVHATRLMLERANPETLAKMADDSTLAAEMLATCDCTVLLYGCTSGSLIGGVGWDRELSGRMQEATGIPTTTTSTAVIEAFEELGVRRVAVATPYIDSVNQTEKEFFEGHGVEVVNIEGLGFTRGFELHGVPDGTAYSFGRKVDRPEADCLFVSCTDFRTLDELQHLETDLGKPVMSSNTASLWAVLRLAGVRGAIDGYGEILRHL